MRIFHLTAISFNGYIEFIFNENDFLDKYQVHADLTEGHQRYLLQNLPRVIDELQKFKSPTVTITEVKDVITFELFWNRYDDKTVSSKFKAREVWIKLSEADNVKAYYYLPKYFGNLPYNTRKKYCETYLRSKIWNN